MTPNRHLMITGLLIALLPRFATAQTAGTPAAPALDILSVGVVQHPTTLPAGQTVPDSVLVRVQFLVTPPAGTKALRLTYRDEARGRDVLTVTYDYQESNGAAYYVRSGIFYTAPDGQADFTLNLGAVSRGAQDQFIVELVNERNRVLASIRQPVK